MLHALQKKRDSQLEEVQDRLVKAEERADSLSTAVDALKKENARLGIELEAQCAGGSIDAKLTARLRTLAVQGSAGSSEFAAALKAIKTTSRYPVDLAVALERHLRASLNTDDPASLHDLIIEADEAGFLTPEAVDLAHTLRKQRNIAVHSVPDDSAMRTRALLSLFTAALLWRELSGGSRSAQSERVSVVPSTRLFGGTRKAKRDATVGHDLCLTRLTEPNEREGLRC